MPVAAVSSDEAVLFGGWSLRGFIGKMILVDVLGLRGVVMSMEGRQ